jgi:hypothetical protein
MSRFKRVFDGALLSQMDRPLASDIAIAVRALNSVLELGCQEAAQAA